MASNFNKAERYLKQGDEYKLLSYATSSESVEMTDGTDLQTKMDSVDTKIDTKVDSVKIGTTEYKSGTTVTLPVYTTEEADSTFGADIGLSIDTTTYKMTLELKDKNGTILSNKEIDFPIESMVVNASYANGTLTLTLQNGNTLDVDISSIISGLIPDTRTIAGVDLKDDITATELRTALNVADGAESNQNAFGKITIDSTNIEADSEVDTITLVAGSNVTLTPDATNNTITIGATDTTYSIFTGASSSAAGTKGLVPVPTSGKQNYLLRGDSTWALPFSANYSSTGTTTGLSLTGANNLYKELCEVDSDFETRISAIETAWSSLATNYIITSTTIVTVSSTSAVAAGGTETVSVSFTADTDATGRIAHLVTLGWGVPSAVTVNKSNLSATLTNTSSGSHTLSCIFRIMQYKSISAL